MTTTRSLHRTKTSPFLLSARYVRKAQQYQKEKHSPEWLEIHGRLTACITNHFLDRTPPVLRDYLSMQYWPPLPTADRPDKETNLEKFVEEIVLAIAIPKVTRSLHFIHPPIGSSRDFLYDLLKREFKYYVLIEARDLPDKIIFDFKATAMVQ